MVMDGTKDLITDSTGEKEKARKLQKLGIGGFSVKPRGRCSVSIEIVPQPTDAAFPLTNDTPILATDVECNTSDKLKKKPKRKPKKKTFLDESFPTYLRDAFFGKDLLISCKKMGKASEIRQSHDLALESGPVHNKPLDQHSKNNQPPLQTGTSSVDIKPQVVKDFIPVAGASSKAVTNLTYKSIIKSEIESIKEEHLASQSILRDASGLGRKEGRGPFQDVLGDQRLANPIFRGNAGPVLSKNSAAYLLQQGSSQGINPSLHPNLIQNLQQGDSNSSWLDSEFWEHRIKADCKVWRGLPTEKRQPYLQRARENRAASGHKDLVALIQKEVLVNLKVKKLIKKSSGSSMLEYNNSKDLYKKSVLEENVKLFHSKSLSDIPQFPSTPSSEESLQNAGKAKVFEKRWSSSALDINVTENLLQGNKLIIENQASIQKSLMQDRYTALLHVSKVQSPVNSPLSIPDAAVSPSLIMKASSETFQSRQSPLHTAAALAAQQKQVFRLKQVLELTC
ncbi:histone-lysine N-methyltransferase 2D [Caerostris extrusa]|uniref:Histone-lysine N-methyltransferase 2D n=1 Tax=Caerostris extrusa TaxID=172846 RepID=A0AAV4UAM0_CAEEX|nr:histone-lysine N-methyltransferase 2D [Caerostris extrusa]